jgi:hypothetical protein
MKGIDSNERPARSTYVHSTPIALINSSITETSSALNEHRIKLFCRRKLNETDLEEKEYHIRKLSQTIPAQETSLP